MRQIFDTNCPVKSITNEPVSEKTNDLIVFQFVVLQMRISSPVMGLQTCAVCLKLIQGSY